MGVRGGLGLQGGDKDREVGLWRAGDVGVRLACILSMASRDWSKRSVNS